MRNTAQQQENLRVVFAEGLVMTAVVSGIFSQGKLELLQTPVGIRDGKVCVIVIEEDETKAPSSQIQFGMFSGGGRMSTEEDFRVGECRV